MEGLNTRPKRICLVFLIFLKIKERNSGSIPFNTILFTLTFSPLVTATCKMALFPLTESTLMTDFVLAFNRPFSW